MGAPVKSAYGGRCWGYGRASTAAQVGSPETQKAIIRDYCQRAGLPFKDEFFIDPATSGKVPIGERPAGKLLLQNLKRGDHIVVARLDRLSRSITNFARILETIEGLGVTLHVCDIPGGELNPNNHIGRLLISILVAFADYERRLNSIRVQEGNASLRSEGHVFGERPKFGYRFRKQWSDRLKKHIKVVEPHPDEQRVLRKMLEMRVKGASQQQIADWLNHKAKIRGRRGGWWHQPNVARALQTAYKALAESERGNPEWRALKQIYDPEPTTGVLADDDDDLGPEADMGGEPGGVPGHPPGPEPDFDGVEGGECYEYSDEPDFYSDGGGGEHEPGFDGVEGRDG